MGVRWPGIVALAISFSSAEASVSGRCGSNGVALQVLGSGGPELQDRRASTSYLIWQRGVARVLVDIGGGAALRFGESGATMSDLDLILLTHLHVDHVGDLPALVKSSFFEDRRRELPLFGPPGNHDFPSTRRFVQTLFGEPGGAYRYLGEFVSPSPTDSYRLVARDVAATGPGIIQIYDRQGVRVFATRVIHGDVPAVAYRVEIGKLAVAFSGDTDGNDHSLEQIASNADVFVAHNAVPEGATGVERALHMPPSTIGHIASAAKVRRLVLSHRMLRTLGHEAETAAVIRKSYAGPIVFADDLQCFAVTP